MMTPEEPIAKEDPPVSIAEKSSREKFPKRAWPAYCLFRDRRSSPAPLRWTRTILLPVSREAPSSRTLTYLAVRTFGVP